MKTKIAKRALIKSNVYTAISGLLFLTNSIVFKADSVTGNQLTSEKNKFNCNK